jgi:hypothetical protein
MNIKKYSNYMAMHDTLEDAKQWIPKTEHEDIRCYVEIEHLDMIKKAVRAQSEDETLWCVNIPGEPFKVSILEGYLQQSLRWLHQVIENNDEIALKKIIDQANDDI